MLRVDLLPVEGVRGNRKNSINSFWGRESDEAKASAPLKRRFIEDEGKHFLGSLIVACAPIVNYFLAWIRTRA